MFNNKSFIKDEIDVCDFLLTIGMFVVALTQPLKTVRAILRQNQLIKFNVG